GRGDAGGRDDRCSVSGGRCRSLGVRRDRAAERGPVRREVPAPAMPGRGVWPRDGQGFAQFANERTSTGPGNESERRRGRDGDLRHPLRRGRVLRRLDQLRRLPARGRTRVEDHRERVETVPGAAMKITRAEPIPVWVPLKAGMTAKTAHGEHATSPYVIVKVHTDEGLVGLGEATISGLWSGETQAGTVAAIADYIAPAL